MNEFHIIEDVAHGRHAFVYKARRHRTVEFVAAKKLERAHLDLVHHEVQLLSHFAHPHILGFFNWYQTTRHIWIVLELCPGGNVGALLAADGRMPPATVRSFGLDVLSGLQYLHARSIVFGNAKPSALLLDEYGVVKLAKFRFAQAIGSAKSSSGGRSSPWDAARERGGAGGEEGEEEDAPTRLMQGSAAYAAPELFTSHGVASYASDLWSFGCVLYELATGRAAFGAPTLRGVLRKVEAGCDATRLAAQLAAPRRAQGRAAGVSSAWGCVVHFFCLLIILLFAHLLFVCFYSFVPTSGEGDAEEEEVEDDAALDALHSLLRGLLDTNPARRSTWDTVLAHRFWGEGGARRVQRRALAPQPHFERLSASAAYSTRAGTGLTRPQSEIDAMVGLVLGSCARRREERAHENSAWASAERDDVVLPSNDTELDFRPGLVYAAPPLPLGARAAAGDAVGGAAEALVEEADSLLDSSASASRDDGSMAQTKRAEVSVLLFTVTLYANLANSLTRSP